MCSRVTWRQQCELYHSGRRHVDAGDGARANVIGQVTQDDAVHQRRAEVLGEHHLQPALDDLEEENNKQTAPWSVLF